jgi:hypothetical protein
LANPGVVVSSLSLQATSLRLCSEGCRLAGTWLNPDTTPPLERTFRGAMRRTASERAGQRAEIS